MWVVVLWTGRFHRPKTFLVHQRASIQLIFSLDLSEPKVWFIPGKIRGWNVNKLWLSSSIFRTTKVTLWFCRFSKPCSFLPFIGSLKSIQLLRANQLPHSQLWTGTLDRVLEYKSNHVRRRRLFHYPICPTEESFYRALSAVIDCRLTTTIHHVLRSKN